MNNVINIDSLCPWDLALVIAGTKCQTIEPTVAKLRELSNTERNAAINSAALSECEKEIAETRSRGEEPTRAQSDKLARLESFVKSQDEIMRKCLGSFIPAEFAKTLESASFSELESAMVVASAYFEMWQKKKRMAAYSAGFQAAGLEPKAAQDEADRRVNVLSEAIRTTAAKAARGV